MSHYVVVSGVVSGKIWAEAIPEAWLDEKRQNACMPINDNDLRPAIIDGLIGNANSKGWRLYPIELKSKKFSSYRDACEFARDYCNNRRDTELSEESENDKRIDRRTRYAPSLFMFEDSGHSVDQPSPPLAELPASPLKSYNHSFSNLRSPEIQGSPRTPRAQASQLPKSFMPSSSKSLPSPCTQFQADINDYLKNARNFVANQGLCFDSFEGQAALTVLAMRETKKMHIQILNELKKLQRSNVTRDAPEEEEFKKLSTMDEYNEFVKKLEDGNFYKKVVRELSRSCTENLQSTIRNLMNALLDQQLQTKFNKTGSADQKELIFTSFYNFF